MMKTKTLVLGCVVLLFLNVSFGQDHWSAEFRPRLNFPTENLGDANLGIGYGFEMAVAYRFIPHLSGYIGWGWSQFKAEDSFAGANADFEETGYTFGLHFIYPIGDSNLSYLVRTGIIYNHIEIENTDGSIAIDTGHGFGWQVGAGLEIKLDDKWSIRPELRYRSLSRGTEIGMINTDLNLNYIAIGVGISRMF